MAISITGPDVSSKAWAAFWRDVRRMLDLEFPDVAMVAEWSNPSLSLRCGYDMDFVLNEIGGGYSTLMRDYYNHGGSLLCAVNPSGSSMEVSLPAGVSGTVQGDILFEIGSSSLKNGKLTVGAQSFAVIR